MRLWCSCCVRFALLDRTLCARHLSPSEPTEVNALLARPDPMAPPPYWNQKNPAVSGNRGGRVAPQFSTKISQFRDFPLPANLLDMRTR